MLLTLQALWILLFSFVGRTFLIKSSLSWMIHSIWLKTKFEVLDIPAKILAFCSCHTWYTVATKLSLRDKLTKLLPCQVTVAHRIHSSQPFVILRMSYLSQTSHHIALVLMCREWFENRQQWIWRKWMKDGSGCVVFLLVFRLDYRDFKVNKMEDRLEWYFDKSIWTPQRSI